MTGIYRIMRRTQNYPHHEAKIISRKVIYFGRKTTFGGAMRFVFLNMTRIDLANSHIIINDYKISLWIRPLNKSSARDEKSRDFDKNINFTPPECLFGWVCKPRRATVGSSVLAELTAQPRCARPRLPRASRAAWLSCSSASCPRWIQFSCASAKNSLSFNASAACLLSTARPPSASSLTS